MYKCRLKILITLVLFLLLTSFTHEPQIHEPFVDYRIQQIEQADSAPIDWDSLDYNDRIWGWYYKQLWYLYHANSGETPPWLLPKTPIEDDVIPYLIMCGIFAVFTHIHTNRHHLPLTNRHHLPPNKIK